MESRLEKEKKLTQGCGRELLWPRCLFHWDIQGWGQTVHRKDGGRAHPPPPAGSSTLPQVCPGASPLRSWPCALAQAGFHVHGDVSMQA